MPAAQGTLLSSPSNTLVKARYREQYVSEGLNKKLTGLIPQGVVRGGRLGTSVLALRVTIEADPSDGDSVYSYIDANGHQLTHRQIGDVIVDLTSLASTTIWIALYIDYTVSGDTVAQWRAYTAAQLAAETETLLVLGRVVVPASGVIAASAITPHSRESAWKNIGREIREWRQVITGGSFEDCRDIAAAADGEEWPDWDLIGSYGLFTGVNVSVTDSEARTGRHSLALVMTGAGTQSVALYWAGSVKVFPGQLVHGSIWVKGASYLPGSGGSGFIGIALQFLDETGSSAGTVFISNPDLSGTFDWTEIEFTGEVPTGATTMWVSVQFDDNNQSSTGTLYFDDVRVWLERGKATDEYQGDGRDDHFGGSMRSQVIDVPPPANIAANLSTLVENMLRLRQTTAVGGVLQALLGARDRTTEFDLTMEHGGLNLHRLIQDVGQDMIGSAANGALPRLHMPIPGAATARYVLLWEADNSASSEPHMRCYATENSDVNGSYTTALVFTVNARWTGSQWTVDQSGSVSSRFDLALTDLHFYVRSSGAVTTWDDDDWDDGVIGTEYFTVGTGGGSGLMELEGDVILYSADPDIWLNAGKEGNLVIVAAECFEVEKVYSTVVEPQWVNQNNGINPYYDNAQAYFSLDFIPDGATIEEIRFWCLEGSANSWTFYLMERKLNNGDSAPSDSIIDSQASSGTGGGVEEIIMTPSHTVSKAMTANMRALRLEVLGPSTKHTNDRFHGAIVRYTASKMWA